MSAFWTDDRVEQLRTLRAEGLSFSKIAARIGGISRNGCIGKASRMEMPAGEGDRKLKPRMFKTRPPAPPPIPEPEPISPPVTLIAAGPSHCRWPLWSDDARHDFRICGHAPEGGSPYCTHHRRRSMGAGTKSERVAA